MKQQARMQVTPDTYTLSQLIDTCTTRLETVFINLLANIPALDLRQAMEYTLINNNGKRIRPLIIYATGSVFKAPFENLDIPAVAVELIHTYSLIHDDLPCMDDADFRRGKPACHKAYNEGIAVLTGDALHTLAMQVISGQPASLDTAQRLAMIKVLSEACGPYGMAAGQTLDITVMHDRTISPELLMDIYRLKTGALISACVELGRLASHQDDENDQRALAQYSRLLGLAFQIQDDILDMEGNVDKLGKPLGQDAEHNKVTYPKLYGMSKAKTTVEELYEQALETINYLGDRANLLRDLTRYMLRREY